MHTLKNILLVAAALALFGFAAGCQRPGCNTCGKKQANYRIEERDGKKAIIVDSDYQSGESVGCGDCDM